MILSLAARYPHAHEQFIVAAAAATEWAAAQVNGIGEKYGTAMQTRMRGAFRSGVLGERGPIENSNYDKPLARAFKSGQELRDAILKLTRPT